MRNIYRLSLGAVIALGTSSVAVGQTPTPPRPPTVTTPAMPSVPPTATTGRAMRPPVAATDSAARQAVPRARRATRARAALQAQRAQALQRAPRMQRQQGVQRMQQQRIQQQRVQPMQRRQALLRMRGTPRVQRMQQQRVQQLRGLPQANRFQGSQRAQGARRMARPGQARPLQRSQASPQRPGTNVTRRDLFRGMTLSEAQTSQMAAIRERSRARAVESRQQLRPDRTPGVRPDSARRAAMRERARTAQAQAGAMRQQELNEMRAVLTPEQQTTFDANRQRVVERNAARRERMTRAGQSPRQPRPL